jgi:hypothetical protein
MNLNLRLWLEPRFYFGGGSGGSGVTEIQQTPVPADAPPVTQDSPEVLQAQQDILRGELMKKGMKSTVKAGQWGGGMSGMAPGAPGYQGMPPPTYKP